jgi:hypothetical protein
MTPPPSASSSSSSSSPPPSTMMEASGSSQTSRYLYKGTQCDTYEISYAVCLLRDKIICRKDMTRERFPYQKCTVLTDQYIKMTGFKLLKIQNNNSIFSWRSSFLLNYLFIYWFISKGTESIVNVRYSPMLCWTSSLPDVWLVFKFRINNLFNIMLLHESPQIVTKKRQRHLSN